MSRAPGETPNEASFAPGEPGGAGQAAPGNPYEPPAPNPPPAPRLRVSYGAPVTPTGQFGFYVHANGTGAVISKGAWLPDICVKCGTAEALTRRTLFFGYTPWWLYATACLGLLPFYVAQSAQITGGGASMCLCARCRSRYAWGVRARNVIALPILFWYLLVVGVFLMLGEGLLVAFASFVIAILLWLPLIGLAALVVTKFANPRTLVASEMAPFGMTLEGMHPEALRASVAYAAAYGGVVAQAPGQPYAPPPGYGR
jgi:uncharacterized membrane protein